MWVSFTTLKLPDSIISRSTFPGPTLGSWSTSPTRISRVPTFTARSRECIRLDVHHGHLIYNDDVGIQRILLISVKMHSPCSGLPFRTLARRGSPGRRCRAFPPGPVPACGGWSWPHSLLPPSSAWPPGPWALPEVFPSPPSQSTG